MNPRAEAFDRLDGLYEVRVLEPSPPAVTMAPWFADDPVARGEVAPGRLLVSPVRTGDTTWAQLADDDAELAAWCAERWLAAYPRLGPPPRMLERTRVSLHRLAERVLKPAREHANGKIGLRYTCGGFGTPFFGAGAQVRVAGGELIVDADGAERRAPITTLAAAAEHLGPALLPQPAADRSDGGDDRGVLDVDHEAAAFLGQWYGFAASVLEELRAESSPDAEPSRVQLWPEHFDMALELGAERAGVRATYGLSPGDQQHPEPYAYVAPWTAPPPGPVWNATGYPGAELTYAELRAASHQRAAALDFFRARAAALAAA